MKQRLLKSWMLYSAVYSFVSTIFLFLFRKWIRYELVETLSIQEILGTITLYLLIILFLGLMTAGAMMILNRQAERKMGEQLLMIQRAKYSLVKEEDKPNWINEATVVDLTVFYEQTAAISERLENLSLELQTKVQMKIHWDIEDVQLPEGVEDHLFRIAQELLSNTLRHSHATTLEVYLRQTDSNVLFKIEDNGVGFNTEEILPGSYGINNMKERVQGLGGQVKIVSFPNQGTTIEIKIPLSRNMEGE